MTLYFYLASDQPTAEGNGSLELAKVDQINIAGFDYPIQREVFNGVMKRWELRELHQYIINHMAQHETCRVQLASLVNSNLVELKVQEKTNLLFGELVDSKQLLLSEGRLLTIIKEPQTK